MQIDFVFHNVVETATNQNKYELTKHFVLEAIIKIRQIKQENSNIIFKMNQKNYIV